jgi:hypothetical protein
MSKNVQLHELWKIQFQGSIPAFCGSDCAAAICSMLNNNCRLVRCQRHAISKSLLVPDYWKFSYKRILVQFAKCEVGDVSS